MFSTRSLTWCLKLKLVTWRRVTLLNEFLFFPVSILQIFPRLGAAPHNFPEKLGAAHNFLQSWKNCIKENGFWLGYQNHHVKLFRHFIFFYLWETLQLRLVIMMKSQIEFQVTNCKTLRPNYFATALTCMFMSQVTIEDFFFCRRSSTGQQWSGPLSNTRWPLMPRIRVFFGRFCRKTKISITLITTMSTSISHDFAKASKKSYCKTIEMECSRFYNWRAGVRYRQIWTLVHLPWPGPWKRAFLKDTVCRFNGRGSSATFHIYTYLFLIFVENSSMSPIQFCQLNST